MLKFICKVFASSQKCGLFTSVTRYSNFSSSTSAELKNVLPSQNDIAESNGTSEDKPQKSKVVYNFKSHNSMVAAAFASLQENQNSDIKTPFTDKKIDSASTTEELLSVSEGSGVSRRHALKVVSVLADWAMSGKVNLKDFEADPRFIRLCRILTKGTLSNQKSMKPSLSVQSEDLSTILGVTADDEAAKLVECITLPQMVKQSGDLLYSMSSLNFIDENLLAKVSNDICHQIDKSVTKKSSVIGSILTSVGLLKYKDPALLDALSEWIAENYAICRAQDIFSLLMTLAILQYTPQNVEKLYEVILPLLTPSEAGKALQWLEVVWSLVLLGRATEEHVSGVLNSTFIDKLMITEPESLPVSAKLKLLNIDGAAEHLLKGYNGPRIPSDSPIKDTEVLRTKDKREMADSVVDALSHLIRSDLLLRTKINTKYGFYIDAECLLDKKCSPLPLHESNSRKDGVKNKFHNVCVSLKDMWLKALTDCENIVWLCDQCKHSFFSETLSLKKEIDALKKEKSLTEAMLTEVQYSSELQKTMIKVYEEQIATLKSDKSVKSYNEVVKTPGTNIGKSHKDIADNSAVLVVKSNKDCSSDNVFSDVTKSVNPAALNIYVNKTHKIKKDDKSLEALKTSLRSSLGQGYSFDKQQKLNPRMMVEPTGLNAFACEILKTQGYRILSVPYTEFKPSDKLIHRVKYLETKLKELMKT
nr:unnamed protein product [Callosobruchus analis]